MKRVIYAIEQKLPSLLPKQLEDSHRCEFGIWLDGEGDKWYGELKGFSELLAQHQAMHDLCQQAALLLIKDEHQALQLISVQLKEIRTELLDSLQQLRYEAHNAQQLH